MNYTTKIKNGIITALLTLSFVLSPTMALADTGEDTSTGLFASIKSIFNRETPVYERDLRAEKIEAFFSQWDFEVPAARYAHDFVFYGDLYGVKPELVAAIAFNESAGFQKKFMCGHNGFGWAIYPGDSCKNSFRSIRHSIRVVSYNLGGHNEATARYYADKSVEGIINSYNPPHINPDYLSNVLKAINDMETWEV